MMQKINKGFTLIELLVVIAIIGILAGIVLASLGNARQGATDASAKETMSSLRATAELYYSGTGATTYGAAGAGTMTSAGVAAGMTGFCADADTAPLLKAAAKNAAHTLNCSVGLSGGSYEADVVLSDGSTIFCVDSNGFSGKPSGTPTRAATAAVKCQ